MSEAVVGFGVAAYLERAVLHPRLCAHLRGVQAPAVSDLRGQSRQGKAPNNRFEFIMQPDVLVRTSSCRDSRRFCCKCDPDRRSE
jgi:hypothetical protein